MAKQQKKTRTIRAWDDEVAECFDLWGGVKVAAYFEALRYRQQLTPDEYFSLPSNTIEHLTGLTRHQQRTSRGVLEGSGWIELRTFINRIEYRLTALARKATGHIPHRVSTSQIYKKAGLSTGRLTGK